MIRIILTSTPMIHAPGLWRWAVAGYHGSQKEKMIDVFMAWQHPKLTRRLLASCLSGRKKVEIKDDAVIIKVRP